MGNSLRKALLAECLGTAWLVFCGCGSVVLAGDVIGAVGIALAFGLSVTGLVYTLGPVSGGHFNPAVSVGLAVARRFEASHLPAYIIAQVLGAILGAGVLFVIATGHPEFDAKTSGMASTGYGALSPGGYDQWSALITEMVTTFLLMLVILGSTDEHSQPILAGLVIGLTLAAIIMATAPVAGASVNPARSTGPALFAQGAWLSQLWLFWVAPIVGAVIAALAFRFFTSGRT